MTSVVGATPHGFDEAASSIEPRPSGRHRRTRPSGGLQPQFDAAVVFVHGIGKQAKGATLQDGVSALCAAGATRLRTAVAGDPDAIVTSVRDQHGKARTVLCIEAWWDPLIHEHDDRPRPWRVWAWALMLLPFLLSVGGGVALTAAAYRHEQASASATTPNLVVRCGRLVKLAAGAFQSAYLRGAVLAPLLVVVLLVPGGLWLLGESIWLLATGRPGPLTRGLRFILGDAWAYADSKARESVLDHLASQVRFAQSLSPRVTVVGHSQGAALSRMLTEHCSFEALVTVGSGANYLGAARRRRWGRVAYGWALTLFYGIGVSVVAHIAWESLWPQVVATFDVTHTLWKGVLSDFRGDPTSHAVTSATHQQASSMLRSVFDPLTVVGLIFGLLSFVVLKLVRVDEPTPDWGQPEVDYWVDVASIYDPISVGGAGSAEADAVIAVVNTQRTRSLFREHIRYFDSPDVGVVIQSVALGVPLRSRYTAPNDEHLLLRCSWAWGLVVVLPLAYIGPLGLARGALWVFGALWP